MNLEGCPKCESSRVYKAHRRGKLERVLVLLGGEAAAVQWVPGAVRALGERAA